MEDNTSPTYDELFEYKKLTAKLEDALEQKDTELTSMSNLYNELKSLNERARRECDDLNAKLIKSYTERNLLEKKYEAALEQERANLSKQSEIYKDKILKLSSYDPQNMKTKIEKASFFRFFRTVKCDRFIFTHFRTLCSWFSMASRSDLCN